MLDRYVAQVRLLVSVIPDIGQETAFALKGGTAINLFCRDLPRLSVDIDLTWLPIADHRSSLREIDDALERIVVAVRRRDPGMDVRRVAGGGGGDTRILARSGQARVKIEASPVVWRAVHPPRSMVVSERVSEQFGFVEANVLAFEDLYGSKLHAALDRRHPRDLFDGLRSARGPRRRALAAQIRRTRLLAEYPFQRGVDRGPRPSTSPAHQEP